MSKPSTSNNQRSNVKNSNNPAYVADRANRVQLGHPDVPPSPPEVTTQISSSPPKEQG